MFLRCLTCTCRCGVLDLSLASNHIKVVSSEVAGKVITMSQFLVGIALCNTLLEATRRLALSKRFPSNFKAEKEGRNLLIQMTWWLRQKCLKLLKICVTIDKNQLMTLTLVGIDFHVLIFFIIFLLLYQNLF